MRYFANPCNDDVRRAMNDGLIDLINTPAQASKLIPVLNWCADNGCYSDKWKPETWWSWLTKQPPTMKFAVAPDVVADWNQTLERFDYWQPRMTELGVPVACVAQDGATPETVPWQRISCLFIGGTTEWKLSKQSETLMSAANQRGIWVHVGRVNSFRRLRWARDAGANSADGTCLTFAPDRNLPKLLQWLNRLENETNLWTPQENRTDLTHNRY